MWYIFSEKTIIVGFPKDVCRGSKTAVHTQVKFNTYWGIDVNDFKVGSN